MHFLIRPIYEKYNDHSNETYLDRYEVSTKNFDFQIEEVSPRHWQVTSSFNANLEKKLNYPYVIIDTHYSTLDAAINDLSTLHDLMNYLLKDYK